MPFIVDYLILRFIILIKQDTRICNTNKTELLYQVSSLSNKAETKQLYLRTMFKREHRLFRTHDRTPQH